MSERPDKKNNKKTLRLTQALDYLICVSGENHHEILNHVICLNSIYLKPLGWDI